MCRTKRTTTKCAKCATTLATQLTVVGAPCSSAKANGHVCVVVESVAVEVDAASVRCDVCRPNTNTKPGS